MQPTTETPKQYQCRHIFTDGRRCASPCLRQEEFCYYHHTTRKPVANPRRRRTRRSTFHLPLPEDRSAIQQSIGEVLQRIAANEIDPRRAGLLLYGLQIASLNLPKTQPSTKSADPLQTVEEIITDPELGTLAPRAEVSQTTERKSPIAHLIERIMQNDETGRPVQETNILPTVNAEAEHSRPNASQTRRPRNPPQKLSSSSQTQPPGCPILRAFGLVVSAVYIPSFAQEQRPRSQRLNPPRAEGPRYPSPRSPEGPALPSRPAFQLNKPTNQPKKPSS